MMTDKFILAVIDSPFLGAEFATVMERATADGFHVLYYPNYPAFHVARPDHETIDAVLCMGNCPFDAVQLARMRRLRALLSAVTGVEGFDFEAAASNTVIIGNGQTEQNYVQMAEATVLLMLAALYDFNHTQAVLRENRPRPSPLRAHLLRGRTVGLVGFGQIAQQVARRLAPWGVTLISHVHRDNPHLLALGVERVDLDTLLTRANVVSLHCSLNRDTHHLIDTSRLALMRPDAILVNTARGSLVDEGALFETLSAGRIAGAALDTFEIEPLPLSSPLRTLHNVILTPHMVGHTAECNESLVENAWDSIRRVARGDQPVFTKNPEVLPAWTTRFGAGAGATPDDTATSSQDRR